MAQAVIYESGDFMLRVPFSMEVFPEVMVPEIAVRTFGRVP